ncbi:MAG: DUF1559 domain-containing protein, partial [Thermoguttaceae bacterium]
YHDDYGSLPPAYTVDADGKPLHSWRMLLLPYLEGQSLYEEIRLDEPWDSAYNSQFHDKMPHFFTCPSSGLSGTKNGRKYTLYSVVVGKDTPFPGVEAVKLNEITNGVDKTIFVLERKIPICWMNPTQDIPYDLACEGINVDCYGIGSPHSRYGSGTNAVFGSGRVEFIPDTIEPEQLRKNLTQ